MLHIYYRPELKDYRVAQLRIKKLEKLLSLHCIRYSQNIVSMMVCLLIILLSLCLSIGLSVYVSRSWKSYWLCTVSGIHRILSVWCFVYPSVCVSSWKSYWLSTVSGIHRMLSVWCFVCWWFLCLYVCPAAHPDKPLHRRRFSDHWLGPTIF